MSGQRQASVRPTSGQRQASVRPASGRRQASARPSSGRLQAKVSVRPTSGHLKTRQKGSCQYRCNHNSGQGKHGLRQTFLESWDGLLVQQIIDLIILPINNFVISCLVASPDHLWWKGSNIVVEDLCRLKANLLNLVSTSSPSSYRSVLVVALDRSVLVVAPDRSVLVVAPDRSVLVVAPDRSVLAVASDIEMPKV
ncbi:hypothetical protein PoB_003152000 [Plakobranchus ocellatus]|uniref:Uncharacterized protein n=1 Tax=Plakobranchus ocellatus TaxID=259542 RepID=A0AAV4ACF0_9GAST|nr:hypothetical protein PoB_003152000 [Plakobranchus ocellatus]